jgi:hypothetical protein
MVAKIISDYKGSAVGRKAGYGFVSYTFQIVSRPPDATKAVENLLISADCSTFAALFRKILQT